MELVIRYIEVMIIATANIRGMILVFEMNPSRLILDKRTPMIVMDNINPREYNAILNTAYDELAVAASNEINEIRYAP